MKKFILPLAVTIVAASIIFTSCESSAKKVDDAKQEVAEAQVKLEQARMDSIAEYEKIKMGWDEQISKNEKMIEDYRFRIAKEKEEKRKKSEIRLAELQKENDALKVKMHQTNVEEKNNWELIKADFKRAFNAFDNAMAELGKSIEEITK